MRQTNIKNIHNIPENKLYAFQIAILKHFRENPCIITIKNNNK